MTYKEYFQKNGFVVVPNIVPLEDIKQLRRDYEKQLKQSEALTLTPSEFLKKVGMLDNILSEKVIAHCKEIVSQDYVMYPDFTIRQSLYIPWHTDASYLPAEVSNQSKLANFVQCSIYLQDNNEETGGGLEAVVGSHLDRSIDRKNPTSTKGLDMSTGVEMVRSKAGDLVLWDSRVVHRSISNKNPEEPKLAIQWTISRSDMYSEEYLGYLESRTRKKQHVSDMNGSREEQFLIDALGVEKSTLASKERKFLDKNNLFLSTAAEPKRVQSQVLV